MDKQNRINWLKNRISSMEQCRDEVPFGLSEDESMELSAYKDSLASVTAGKLSKDASESLIAMVEYALSHRICMGMDEGFKSFDPEVEHDFVQEIRNFIASGEGFFTAPPVPEISQLENDVKNIIQLLSDREWAEHFTSTELGKELEGKITDLHNEVPEIKFPEKPDYSGDFTSFKDPVSAYKDGVVDGHKWYEKAFKRLNGWGE